MVDKNSMQDSATNSAGRAARKYCLDSLIAAHEANTTKQLAGIGWDRDAKFAQGFEAIGQQAFAAWLVYRGNCAIGDGDGQPVAARSNRGGKAGRASSNDEYINRVLKTHQVPQEAKSPHRLRGSATRLNVVSFPCWMLVGLLRRKIYVNKLAANRPMRSPFEQDKLRAEPGTHGREHAERAGLWPAILHNFFEYHQHRGR